MKELYDLTAAEAGVAEHFMAGRTYAEIAQIRNVSPETVKTRCDPCFQRPNPAIARAS
ncbi:MAG: helix-turn-helix transcriptional regulator [Gammaproteobacteria bacterium]|nr:helix-turn-helix transcriptional regulator [Gammaproteobacteria bacterium]